jgi:hypothetical protein
MRLAPAGRPSGVATRQLPIQKSSAWYSGALQAVARWRLVREERDRREHERDQQDGDTHGVFLHAPSSRQAGDVRRPWPSRWKNQGGVHLAKKVTVTFFAEMKKMKGTVPFDFPLFTAASRPCVS